MDVFEAIAARRSIGRLGPPAPSPEDVERMVGAATCAPDHGELRPWKFVVLEGEAQDAFGQVLLDAYLERCRRAGLEPTEGQTTKERTKLGRAPMVIVAAARRRESDKIPWDEQVWAVAAAVQNLLLAATALGYGTMWRTGDPAYDDRVKAALGLRPDDAILGFVYVGTPVDDQRRPPREPDTSGSLEWWSPSGAHPGDAPHA